MRKNKDLDKGNLFLLVIPEKYKPIIFKTYHGSLLAGQQGPYRKAMTFRQNVFHSQPYEQKSKDTSRHVIPV